MHLYRYNITSEGKTYLIQVNAIDDNFAAYYVGRVIAELGLNQPVIALAEKAENITINTPNVVSVTSKHDRYNEFKKSDLLRKHCLPELNAFITKYSLLTFENIDTLTFVLESSSIAHKFRDFFDTNHDLAEEAFRQPYFIETVFSYLSYFVKPQQSANDSENQIIQSWQKFKALKENCLLPINGEDISLNHVTDIYINEQLKITPIMFLATRRENGKTLDKEIIFHKQQIESLLSRNHNIQLQDYFGRTALHWAVAGAAMMNAAGRPGTQKMVTFLLEKGIDPYITDKLGRTALDYCTLFYNPPHNTEHPSVKVLERAMQIQPTAGLKR